MSIDQTIFHSLEVGTSFVVDLFFAILNVCVDANVDIVKMADGIGFELFFGSISLESDGKYAYN